MEECSGEIMYTSVAKKSPNRHFFFLRKFKYVCSPKFIPFFKSNQIYSKEYAPIYSTGIQQHVFLVSFMGDDPFHWAL